MAFLTITGTPVEVLTDDAALPQAHIVGASQRAFDGTLRVTVRAEKRNWEFGVLPLTEAQYVAFRTLALTGAPVTCSGDFVNGVAVSCFASLTGETYLADGLGHRRLVKLRLDEV